MGETVISRLAQVFGTDKSKLKKHNRRHEFLLEYLKNKKFQTAIVVDGLGTSLDAIIGKNRFLNQYFIRQFISRVEIYFWCFINGVSIRKTKIIYQLKDLNYKNDIFFCFGYCSSMFLNTNQLGNSLIKRFKGKKIVHLTHYYSNTKVISENINKAGIQYVVAEANLKNSPYFKKFFYFIKEIIILPHVLRKKYKKTKAFSKRVNKALALGTLVINKFGDLPDKDYTNFFKIDTLHPMRKSIYQSQSKLTKYIDSLISFHNKERLEIKEKLPWYQKYWVLRILYDLLFLSESKTYHDLNIVKKYNEYKMFISPEENIGLSSVNFIEGMACGCAYIGLDHSMYTDLDMRDKREFIAYNGTIKDLIKKIHYYQNHQRVLQRIAKRGYNFVRKNFNQKLVMSEFWENLSSLSIAK